MAQANKAMPARGQAAMAQPGADDYVTHRELWAMAGRVDRHFHRVDRKLDQHERENNEHFARLEGKLDQFQEETNQRFGSLEGKLGQFQEETNQRFAKVDDRFNKMERKVDVNQEKTNTQFANMDVKLANLKNSNTLTMLTIAGVVVAILGFLIETR